jgi:hypothetical protein
MKLLIDRADYIALSLSLTAAGFPVPEMRDFTFLTLLTELRFKNLFFGQLFHTSASVLVPKVASDARG